MTVVSSGLDFYIKTLLGHNGFSDIKIAASRTLFTPAGLDARYYDPDNRALFNIRGKGGSAASRVIFSGTAGGPV
jgi:2-hydroxy-3-keto-5-methylthiopentenyl-1-phosphate phosphatase